jgi:dGTP triphosphohydrolase
MSTLKEAIFAEIRKNVLEFELLSDEELNKTIFHHPAGLRLSLGGFIIIKKIFTAYSFELPATIKSRHQKNLSKLSYPYFFTQKRLILFSSGDALVIKLCGSIELFLEDH